MNEQINESITRQKIDVNRRAERNRESLFSALELFLRTGDSVDALLKFRSQHRDFFPNDFYEQSLRLRVRGVPDYFVWYQRLLKMVWEQKDEHGTRLAVLLGLTYPSYMGSPGGDFHKEAQEYMKIELNAIKEEGVVGGHLLFRAEVVPDWTRGDFVYLCTCDFGYAVRELMRENWRARQCLTCRRHFIADKPANTYCGIDCAGAAKRKRDLKYWRTEGSEARRKKAQKR